VLDRIHVLEGRQLVLLNIDEVIRIIRNADEPKAALIERFSLSDRQAEDILEIRLRQLARLEAIKIEQELSQLRDERQKLEDILASPAALKRTVIREIETDAKAFGDDRRTLVQDERKAVAEVRVVDELVTVVVSAKGWVRALKGHEVDPAALQFKPGDALHSVQPCRSVDLLAVLGDRPLQVARELTKRHEEQVGPSVTAALAHFQRTPPQGECTLVLGGAPPAAAPVWDEPALRRALAELVRGGMSNREAARNLAVSSGHSRRALYALLHQEPADCTSPPATP
jgi:DNA gyrase/topoisomerase IV subunit A